MEYNDLIRKRASKFVIILAPGFVTDFGKSFWIKASSKCISNLNV